MKKALYYYKKFIPLMLLVLALLAVKAYCDLELPEYMARILSEGVAVLNLKRIWYLGLIMIIYSLIITVANVIVHYLVAFINSRACRNMRKAIYDRVSEFSNHELDEFTVSSLITRSTNDITQVQMFLTMFMRLVCYAPIMAIGGIVKAVGVASGVSSLAIVIVVAVSAILICILTIMLIAHPRFVRIQKMIDKLNLVAREGLNGMLVVRAFNTQEYEEQRFDNENKKLTKTYLFVNRIMSLMGPIMMLVMNGTSIAIIWIAGYTAQSAVDVANMTAMLQYAMHIVMSFTVLTVTFMAMPRAIVSVKRIGEVLKTAPSVINTSNAQKIENVKGEIKFDNVSYSYAEGSENAIENVSFTASPGTTTAIIGSTGSGKSTLIGLIPRLFDASSGKVTIDGIDVKDFTLQSLRDCVSYVPQKNVLFSGTIKSNIKMADPNGDDERMVKAAEVAQATEFINAKTEGYDSHIAQGGTNVSGGQKQRIAIARALYKKAPIYIFDDSFSALDFKTDAALRKALSKEVSFATVIIVAQRVGTIMNADNILVLDDGKIVGEGKHAQLMKTCTVYADIARSQLSAKELGEV